MIDDLDGVCPADETICFAIDAVACEIDLTATRADQLRAYLNTYVGAARRVSAQLKGG